MVKIKSRINPNLEYEYEYNEKKPKLNAKDENQALDLYEDYEVLPDTPPIMVAVGVQQTHAKDGAFFYRYLYATRDPYFQTALGVIEIRKDEYLNVLDKDGDLVLEKTRPLLFSFIHKETLSKIHEKQQAAAFRKIPVPVPVPIVVDLSLQEESEETQKEKALIEPTRKKGEKGEKEKGKNTLLEGRLAIAKGSQHVETKEEAQKLIEEFKKTSGSHEWIQEEMKNTHYSTVDVPGDGDCFFHVVCKAFASVGLQTTVQKCRDFLADHPSVKKTFQQEQEIFSGFHSVRAVPLESNRVITSRLQEIKDILSLCTTKSPTSSAFISDKGNGYHALEKCKGLKNSPPLSEEQRAVLAKEKETLLEKQRRNNETIAAAQSDIDEFVPHMEEYNTLEKYREYIRTPKFWANEWAIETLEKKLQVKFILFPENTTDIYTVGTLDKPNRYILAAFVNGNHYNLIQYNQTQLFLSFEALPYSVKCLGVQQRFQIPDFTHFRCEVVGGGGDDEEDLEEEENSSEDDGEKDLDKFVLSADAKTHPFSTKEKHLRFFELRRYNKEKIKNKETAGWERVLSDDFLVDPPLTIEGHTWNSVTHYVLAGQFHPHSAYYRYFSADSHTLISQNVAVAKRAVEEPGDYTWAHKKSGHAITDKNVLKNTVCVPMTNVQRDTLTEERKQKRRRTALEAKLKHPLIKHLLISTLDARLYQNDRGNKDTLLMELREKRNVPVS